MNPEGVKLLCVANSFKLLVRGCISQCLWTTGNFKQFLKRINLNQNF